MNGAAVWCAEGTASILFFGAHLIFLVVILISFDQRTLFLVPPLLLMRLSGELGGVLQARF